MTCIDDQNYSAATTKPDLLQRVRHIISTYLSARLATFALRRKQRRDRAAFMNLVGKESWLYQDMGIHEGDVDWASRLPLEINAARELEKIRLQNRKNL